MKPFLTRLSVFCLAGLSLCCGQGNRGTVNGKVTLAKKPVVFGSVNFISAKEVVTAPIRPDGTYTAKDVPYGAYRVSINSPNPARKRIPVERELKDDMKKLFKDRKPKEADPPAPNVDATKWFELPAKYANHDTSDLSVTVTGPTTELNIPLKE